MLSNPMHAVPTVAVGTVGSAVLNLTGESKTDRVTDTDVVNMHSNPMNATATPTAGTETEGKEKTVETEDAEEKRAAIRLGVLYSIYKPECFYFDIINIFHVRVFCVL